MVNNMIEIHRDSGKEIKEIEKGIKNAVNQFEDPQVIQRKLDELAEATAEYSIAMQEAGHKWNQLYGPEVINVLDPRPSRVHGPPSASYEPSSAFLGPSTTPYGPSGNPYGPSGAPYASSSTPYGQPNTFYGQSGHPHGQNSDPYGRGSRSHEQNH